MENEQIAHLSNAEFEKEASRYFNVLMREFALKGRDIFARFPLTGAQLVVLDILAEQGPCKMSDLAKNLHFSMSAVTAIIDKLVELRFVKREHSKEDRRVIYVSLLTKGKIVSSFLEVGRCMCIRELFASVTEEDKKTYLRIVRQVYARLNENKKKDGEN